MTANTYLDNNEDSETLTAFEHSMDITQTISDSGMLDSDASTSDSDMDTDSDTEHNDDDNDEDHVDVEDIDDFEDYM